MKNILIELAVVLELDGREKRNFNWLNLDNSECSRIMVEENYDLIQLEVRFDESPSDFQLITHINLAWELLTESACIYLFKKQIIYFSCEKKCSK